MGAANASADSTVQLLWEGARPYPRVDRIRAAITAGADLDRIGHLAAEHGTGPLLWRALELAGVGQSLGPEADALRSQANLWRMISLVLIPQALEISVRALGDVGYEPVVWKGPSVSARYPEPGLRPMVDFDLLLPEQQHEGAVEVLRKHGWTVARRADRHHYDTALVHPRVPGLFIELHRGTDLWWERSNRLGLRELWERRIPVNHLGFPSFGLPPEVELVSLAAHAGKPFHCFGRLLWSSDLVAVTQFAVSQEREIDWDMLNRLATEWKCKTVVTLAFAQASHLGLVCPEELLHLPDSSVRQKVLRAVVEPQWPLKAQDEALRRRLRYALADTAVSRARLFVGAPTPFTPMREWPGIYARLVPAAVRRAWRLARETVAVQNS